MNIKYVYVKDIYIYECKIPDFTKVDIRYVSGTL